MFNKFNNIINNIKFQREEEENLQDLRESYNNIITKIAVTTAKATGNNQKVAERKIQEYLFNF